MDNLRAERDEPEEFKGRNTKPAAKPKAAVAKPDLPTPGKRGLSFQVVLLVLMCVVIGVLGWQYMEQRDLVHRLKVEQEEAAGFIAQSKLLLARLEGQLSETGAEIAESGSATGQKLAFLDSEMRKLWGVANDQNKKAIKATEDSVAKLAERLSQLEQQDKSQQAGMKVLQTSLTERLEKVAAENLAFASTLDSVSNRLSDVASSSVVVLAEVESLAQEVQSIKALTERIKETDKALASVDASRQQLVQRVIDLERRLSEYQFKPADRGLQIEPPAKK